MYHYTVRAAATRPDLQGPWDSLAWQAAETLAVDQFRPESSTHRPQTQLRLLYDATALYGLFRVQDRYVRSVCTQYCGSVCTDSCVEFFVQPRPDRGYLNFEFNAGGTLHASYVTDPTRGPGGFAGCRHLPPADGQRVGIRSSLPPVIEPELAGPVEWFLGFALPLDLLAQYAGPLLPPPAAPWRANCYKCADRTSHPHWAAWAPVAELNFHRPGDFGTLHFAP